MQTPNKHAVPHGIKGAKHPETDSLSQGTGSSVDAQVKEKANC